MGFSRTKRKQMEISRTKRKQLIWVIDFINKDIDRLSTGEFLKLLFEMGETLLDISPSFITHIPKKGKKLYEGFFREDTPVTRETVKAIQGRIKTFFEKIYQAKDKVVWTAILSFERQVNVVVGQEKIIINESPNLKNDLEFKIAQLIYDCSPEPHRSLENLKRCQAPIGRGGKQKCNNFFWQAYKKEKNYCSTKCVWRAYSFERRMAEKR